MKVYLAGAPTATSPTASKVFEVSGVILSETFFVPLWRIYGGHQGGCLEFVLVDYRLGRVVPSS